MALDEALKPAVGMFSGGFANLASYAWVAIPVVIILAIALGAFIFNRIKKRKVNGHIP